MFHLWVQCFVLTVARVVADSQSVWGSQQLLLMPAAGGTGPRHCTQRGGRLVQNLNSHQKQSILIFYEYKTNQTSKCHLTSFISFHDYHFGEIDIFIFLKILT